MTLRDPLDPEIAKGIAIIPFDEINAEVLPSLRVRFELRLSDAAASGRTGSGDSSR